jgi:hypothetical protein
MPGEQKKTFSFGPAWQGWQDYLQFDESVKNDLRFVRSKQASDFLKEVLVSCEKRKVTIPQGKMFWRARVGFEEEEVQSDEDEEIRVSHLEQRPYSQQQMKPISNWQTEGSGIYVPLIAPWSSYRPQIGQLKISSWTTKVS